MNQSPKLNQLARVPFPESCYDIIVDNAASTNEPSDLVVWFHPVAEHLEDAYYNGYQAIAYKINGTRSEYWRGHLRPSSTNRQHIRVKCVPNILVAVCVQLHTLKGNGFSCKNFTTVFLPEGGAYGKFAMHTVHEIIFLDNFR